MTKLSTLVHRYVVRHLKISVPTINIFRMHVGLLILKEDVNIYNSQISSETGYSLATVKRAWKQLEELELIKRTGYSFRRKIHKGEKFNQIVNELSSTNVEHMAQTELEESYTHGSQGARILYVPPFIPSRSDEDQQSSKKQNNEIKKLLYKFKSEPFYTENINCEERFVSVCIWILNNKTEFKISKPLGYLFTCISNRKIPEPQEWIKSLPKKEVRQNLDVDFQDMNSREKADRLFRSRGY